MKISALLAYSVAFVTFLAGLAIGYSQTPEYRQNMTANSMVDLGKPDRWLDSRYIDAMASHHRGAMLLATQAKSHSTRPEIQALASEILTNEPKLIEELYGWKRDWYKSEKRANDPPVANLSTYDEKFDLRFLNALIAHHEAGIEMTQEVRTKSSNKDILNNADAVENFLTNSLKTLRQWRTAWYQI